MVALPLLQLPSPTAFAADAKAPSPTNSTEAPHSSRSSSDTESGLSESFPPGLEAADMALKNVQLKAEIDRLYQKNLSLRIKVLDRENALLRARMSDFLARDSVDVSLPQDLDGDSVLCYPPSVWVDSSVEETQIAAMAAWSASAGMVPAPKSSRSRRRRAARRASKTARAASVFAPAHEFEASLAMWESWPGHWPGCTFERSLEVEGASAGAAPYEPLDITVELSSSEEEMSDEE